MSNYVASWIDYKSNPDGNVLVLERVDSNTLVKKLYHPPYYFFVEDAEGSELSIFDDKVTRAEFKCKADYNNALAYFRNPRNFPDGRTPKLFETDFSPLKRVLMDEYYGRPTPVVNFALFDIETDYQRAKGFPSPTNPYAIINAVTIYQSWTGKFITIAVPPPEFAPQR